MFSNIEYVTRLYALLCFAFLLLLCFRLRLCRGCSYDKSEPGSGAEALTWGKRGRERERESEIAAVVKSVVEEGIGEWDWIRKQGKEG